MNGEYSELAAAWGILQLWGYIGILAVLATALTVLWAWRRERRARR